VNELFGIAERSAERMSSLIRDLLDLQSAESGPGVMPAKSMDLHEVLHAGLDSVVLLCAEKNISVELHAAEKPLLARGSFGRLVQVLTNLLSNAIKFSSFGSSIEVTLVRRGADALVSVRDFGPGVPPSFSRRVFKKFAQIEPSHSREKSGTGLGLSIAKAIVEQHGGKIGFRNMLQDGGGAEFYFTIPLEENLHGTASREQLSPSSATILIVEDDPDISDLVASAVEAMGFASVRAGSIAEAKKALQNEVIDAVTLDLVMPDNHGLALMEWMQAEPRSENIPVIVVSGYSSSSPAMGDAGRLRSADSSSVRFGLNASRLAGASESFPENVMAWVEKPIRTHVLGSFLRDALEIRAQRTVAYLGPTGGRSLVFLRGVCSRLASVVVLQNLDEAMQFLSCHPCSTLVVVDPSEVVLEALRSRRSRFARSLVVIQWYVEMQDPKPTSARADETGDVVDIGNDRAVGLRFLRVSGTHWAAAAFFQHWLGQGRSLVAS
jgi:CheY-like chemotaxis protein